MTIEEFLKLDYLVFSSHKTMTQSIKSTLNRGGFNCIHAHQLRNINLDDDVFRRFCFEYQRENNRKLQIISVFRDPMQRMISSFFQSLSVEKFGRTVKGREISLRGLSYEKVMEESILFYESFDKIVQRFWYYCAVIDGFGESLEDFIRIFDVQHKDISFDPSNIFSTNEFKHVDLHVSRFDLLENSFHSSLERLVGRKLKLSIVNTSRVKWYSKKYDEFRAGVRVPNVFLTNMYETRKELCRIFYSDYADLFLNRLSRFGLE